MPALTADIRLIVGLGNPGADYVDNRHNAGFWFLDQLAGRLSLTFRFEKRFNADETRYRSGERDVFLLKPQAFMNRSGQSLAAVARFYKFKPQQILVVHDELDLDPGTSRLKQGGGHGGHNGLRDVISHLGDKEFFRLRVGIGHPGDRDQVINYVLHRPSVADRDSIAAAIQDALEIMPLVFEGRMDKAMQALHTDR